MLERILERLKQGGTVSLDGLAAELGVSRGLLEQMLADLARRGLVRRMGDCEDACAECGGCLVKSRGWMAVETSNHR